MLHPTFQKNDGLAKGLIYTVSAVVFIAVVILSRVKIEIDLGFNVHVFATLNAVLNSLVSVELVIALVAVKRGYYALHRNLMISAMGLSVLFLVSYIAHHLLADSTPFGGEGLIRYIYYFILITHIFLAAVILPFILFTAYRGLTGEWAMHRKLAKITWPIWFYVSVTGVVVYLLISSYYQ
jgi:putative membrane protein